MYMNHFYYWKL